MLPELNNLAYVTYSHSNHADVWQMYADQLGKHAPKLPHYAFLDTSSEVFENVHVYKDEDPYYRQYLTGLEKVEEEYLVYLLEDFILYDDVNVADMQKALEFLEQYPEYSYVRLIRSGVIESTSLGSGFYEIGSGSQNVYSMQASIWRKDHLVKLYNTARVDWIRNEAEHDPAYRELGMRGVYMYMGEPKRGMTHYDSSVFPYVSTALVKGKWNFMEYQKELEPLLQKYDIDALTRGVF